MTDGSLPPPSPSGVKSGIRLGALVLLLAVAGLLGATVAVLVQRVGAPPPTPTTTVVRASPSVVVAVRDLARLEGASFHMERVIDLRERQSRFFGLVQAEDAILLVAAGDVTAGVDLTELRTTDVVVDPTARTARIELPPARVLVTRLDSQRTYVHTRQTDTLAERRESLETRARQEAERTLEAAAVEAGLLGRAERSAERTVTSLVRSLGYQDVTVTTRRR